MQQTAEVMTRTETPTPTNGDGGGDGYGDGYGNGYGNGTKLIWVPSRSRPGLRNRTLLDLLRTHGDLLELPTEDGEPLETPWHLAQIAFFLELIHYAWRERNDFYAGGNMFIYYSLAQVRNRDYKGPDFYVVLDVDGSVGREAWVVWEENGRYPNFIFELMSVSTRQNDLTTKKDLYAHTFHTQDYFCYDPETKALMGWHLQGDDYVALLPNAQGWLWSEALKMWIGKWHGRNHALDTAWLRFYTADGELVLRHDEVEQQRAEAERQRAEAERQRAEAERQRAEAAEARLARLQMRLQALGISAGDNGTDV